MMILLETFLVWFPMVLCQTNFLYPYGVGFLTMQSILILVLRLSSSSATRTTQSSKNSNATCARLDFLTVYRSSILYLTFVAILAVDFKVFPRRFAKTEVYGYGLMDVGAASFCFSAGLVSRQAKKRRSSLNWKQVLHTLPLVIIGLLRTWTNKELDYQEHVSEYGVHWNFFFTMGVMAIVPSLVPSILRGTWMLPTSILVLYQSALSIGKLQDYIESAPRICESGSDQNLPCISFVAANREGIFGCLGYLSLYFVGEYVGRDFLWNQKSLSLWKPTIGLSMLFLAFSQLGSIPASRRSTNLTFCLWAAAHNVLLLALCDMILVQKNGSLPIVIETVNRVGLPIFLIANLLTGLVNLTIPTLQVSDGPALLIVLGYICLVGGAAMLVDWAFRTVFLYGNASKSTEDKKNE